MFDKDLLYKSTFALLILTRWSACPGSVLLYQMSVQLVHFRVYRQHAVQYNSEWSNRMNGGVSLGAIPFIPV